MITTIKEYKLNEQFDDLNAYVIDATNDSGDDILVYVYDDQLNSLFWYVQHGGTLINATNDEINDDQNIDGIEDVYAFTSNQITSLNQFNNVVEDYLETYYNNLNERKVNESVKTFNSGRIFTIKFLHNKKDDFVVGGAKDIVKYALSVDEGVDAIYEIDNFKFKKVSKKEFYDICVAYKVSEKDIERMKKAY